MEVQFKKVAVLSELPKNGALRVEVSGKAIALCQIEGQIFAIDDMCTHAYASLSDGDISGEEIECPLHGARFNIKTGVAVAPPAVAPVKTYEVRVVGDDVEVQI